METMSGSAALMRSMKKEGVKQVFGLPGGANLPMYDELFKSDIRHILVRHEQSAAHMADGFGRVSRKPGVCFATSGPGATNILTGIATAQADSAPMVAVTGQVPVKMIGRDAFQESDIIGMSNPFGKICISTKNSRRSSACCTGLGTMGWGFPAAIGAKVAKPDVPVVDIAGDGSFNMTELACHLCTWICIMPFYDRRIIQEYSSQSPIIF